MTWTVKDNLGVSLHRINNVFKFGFHLGINGHYILENVIGHIFRMQCEQALLEQVQLVGSQQGERAREKWGREKKRGDKG